MNTISSQENDFSPSLLDSKESAQKCLEVIQLIIDDEASDEDITYFKNKISCCTKSMSQYHLTKELKEAMKKVGYVCPPDNLEHSIMDCIKDLK